MSPPKIQRRINSRQSSLKSIDSANTPPGNDTAALRRLVAELQAQNQQLQVTVKSQQSTIKQLQVCHRALAQALEVQIFPTFLENEEMQLLIMSGTGLILAPFNLLTTVHIIHAHCSRTTATQYV